MNLNASLNKFKFFNQGYQAPAFIIPLKHHSLQLQLPTCVQSKGTLSPYLRRLVCSKSTTFSFVHHSPPPHFSRCSHTIAFPFPLFLPQLKLLGVLIGTIKAGSLTAYGWDGILFQAPSYTTTSVCSFKSSYYLIHTLELLSVTDGLAWLKYTLVLYLQSLFSRPTGSESLEVGSRRGI